MEGGQIQIIGHQWAVDLLKRQQLTERVPQSLLLAGPPNVGKSSLARYFAQSLNCEAEESPCGRCLSCRKFLHDTHPDVRIFDKEDEPIKIDAIRELQRELTLSPNEGQYRIALLCNFERATTSAANALLKTLEEPPPQVILILTTTQAKTLLSTIVSRCQMITLRPLPKQEIIEGLQTHWGLPPERAELLAQLSTGRLGWAIKAWQDGTVLERREQHLQELMELLRMSRSDRIAYAQKLSRDSGLLKETLRLWLAVWRDVLLLHVGGQTPIRNLDWQETLLPLAQKSTLLQIQEVVRRLRTALSNLEYHVNPRLNLEIVLLKLPQYNINNL